MITDAKTLIADFVQVAHIAGFEIDESEIAHKRLLAPHHPPSLPKGKQAVYTFSLASVPDLVLKVGKAGPRSNARYKSQHYDSRRAKSTLASSLLNTPNQWGLLQIKDINENNVGAWIRKHTDRDDFLIPSSYGPLLLSLFEVFLQCRLQPIFEGYK